jgi:hypothetical protein
MRRARMAALLVVLSLAACGGDDGDNASTNPTAGVEGRAGLCDDLQLLGKSLAKVQALGPSSTLKDAQDARADVSGALSELSEAETNVTARHLAQLQFSFQSFDAEIDSLASKGASAAEALGERAASLRARATALAETQALMTKDAACGARS